ncbi:MAG: DedA family protein [Armatimonadetes bacterium]|nr:DedA family protein [Armatimonadota bacterium]
MIDKWSGLAQMYFAQYGYMFVFVALLLENVLFLGAIIPGAVVLILCGWLSQKGEGFPSSLVLVGFLGTVSGDVVSYTIGKKVGTRLLVSKKWGKGLTAMCERVRNEPMLLMFCHFVSYLRMFVPLSAGVSGVPFRRWLPLDASGAALWVASHISVGYFLSLSEASAYMKQVAVVVLALLVLCISVRAFLIRRHVEIP